jgi:uncharacterized membrane protein YfcA
VFHVPVELGVLDLVVAGGAGFLAGGVNAVAGGGTLISFPALVALGVPAVNANITNTVALCPGYFGAAHSQRAELAPQRHRLPWMAVVAGIGGLLGSILLTFTSNDTFRAVVPFLIVGACALLAVQEPLRRWLRRSHPDPAQAAGASAAVDLTTRPSIPLLAGVFLAAIYGGFFGAGLSIMLLAVLGVLLDDSLIRLNALKSALALVINVMAALFFVFSGEVVWSAAIVMAVTSLLGGALGGRLANRLKPNVLRVAVVVFGLAVAVKFWV